MRNCRINKSGCCFPPFTGKWPARFTIHAMRWVWWACSSTKLHTIHSTGSKSWSSITHTNIRAIMLYTTIQYYTLLWQEAKVISACAILNEWKRPSTLIWDVITENETFERQARTSKPTLKISLSLWYGWQTCELWQEMLCEKHWYGWCCSTKSIQFEFHSPCNVVC